MTKIKIAYRIQQIEYRGKKKIITKYKPMGNRQKPRECSNGMSGGTPRYSILSTHYYLTPQLS